MVQCSKPCLSTSIMLHQTLLLAAAVVMYILAGARPPQRRSSIASGAIQNHHRHFNPSDAGGIFLVLLMARASLLKLCKGFLRPSAKPPAPAASSPVDSRGDQPTPPATIPARSPGATGPGALSGVAPLVNKEYHITDLASLFAILSTAQGTISIDLGGRTVAGRLWRAAQDLAVQPGRMLRLSNGRLSLPPGCVLRVAPGGSLELYSVEVHGQGAPGLGLVSIRGAGAGASLVKCRVHATPRMRGSTDAVLVADGGTATLKECTLTAAAGGWAQHHRTRQLSSCTRLQG
jgi:hypothetical protein